MLAYSQSQKNENFDPFGGSEWFFYFLTDFSFDNIQKNSPILKSRDANTANFETTNSQKLISRII